MTVSVSRIQHYLKSFKLGKLFIEELGWDRHSGKLLIEVDSTSYTLAAIAEKRGVQIFTCSPDAGGIIPGYATRRKIEKQVTKSAYEHLIIFIDNDNSMQIWQWVSRQPGLRAAYREHHYHPRYHSGEYLVQKLTAITFSLSEEEGLTLTGVAFKLRDAFDRDKITKKFYDYFKRQHAKFLDFIQGITQQGNREWYASLMLNRLMFVYFIQRKGFLDGDSDYLKNRLKMVQDRKGKGKFLSFYRYFLLRLFHEGFSQQPKQRNKDLEDLLGKVPYLNGGLFELHELEREYPKIDIPDEAFEKLFAFFDQYEWHLDNRPLSNDNEINPDVLGYIFEKYINQKQMGAYYTKEDITEYISKNTVIPYLFNTARKKCAVAFQEDSSLWRLLKNAPLCYIYPAIAKGVINTNGEIIPLPGEIAKGINNVTKRKNWNEPADAEYALPTETWREHVTRRQRCLDIIDKLTRGKICQINDLITYNLDIRQFAEDAITECEGPELLRAFYQAISSVTVLDPTCGSGAFLFAALNILEPLYDACLDRMQGFVDDLERSGKRFHPEKFSDFRHVLKEIDRHPNRRFFVLKSIVVNNLFGVDIMEEAVEICKLRLFLKLVAQVDRVKQLEPLPDIDFNMRAGNTLVGFVSVDEIRKAAEYDANGQQQILLNRTKDEIKQIEENARIVDLAFKRFHEMQTEQEMDAHDFKAAKEELRDRLKELTGKLDEYLAKEYSIDLKKKKAFKGWCNSHQPFHWFVEFYGIMSRGGFDVIIGNPPWKEYSSVKRVYQIKNYSTEQCGNLYAICTERGLRLRTTSGYISFIVQLPLTCSTRMKVARALLKKHSRNLYTIPFDDRPGKLFDGLQHCRSAIFLSEGSKDSNSLVWTTRYQRWPSVMRPWLFFQFEYAKSENAILSSTLFPKFASRTEVSTFEKVKNHSDFSIETLRANHATKTYVFYQEATQYWMKATIGLPYYEKNGVVAAPAHGRYVFLNSHELAETICAILNSSLFYVYFIAYSDCFHLNDKLVKNFLLPSKATADDRLQKLGRDLQDDLVGNSLHKTITTRDGSEISYAEFKVWKSKPIIDEIDRILAEHYQFTQEEYDFLINYDAKYRLSSS
ncbi:MAG: hypothetical protein PVI94_03210 [Desulfobacterales bacterium]|jgi:hypothetical protein